jgi:hypothetical protein
VAFLLKYARNIVKPDDDYAAALASTVKAHIYTLEGSTFANLENVSYFVNKKIEALQKKSREFSEFGTAGVLRIFLIRSL